MNLQDIYQTIVHIGCRLANTPHGFIYAINKKQEELELKYGAGFYRRCQGAKHNKEEPSLAGTVWKTGRALSIQDIQHWPGRARDCSDGWDNVRSVMGMPLSADYGVIAVWGVGFLAVGHVLTEADSMILKRFGKMAAVILQHNADNVKIKPRPARPVYGLPALTGREETVLNRMASGLSNQEIAQELRVELSTVKTHINHLFSKLEVHNRAQALIKAWELGLIVKRR
ncbi:helix-turn-helix transcriptional regulator [Sporomusa termitida]|uniref:HTH-type transcriptional regulator MalT n=1 Tax=Sporomusa termitida TaxID=2377 RepID=A0A517DXF1_9FIRM|nr:LuxR C-terminal-related transcriptional regulator [Sporomusa termitida]QDR82028.1 HTH-type transcriptional regulator MalT [Sporomusa termitida]